MPKDTTWLRDLADILRGLDPPWIFATLVALLAVWRAHLIIAALSKMIQDHRRVSDEINRKKERAAVELEERRAKLEDRRGTRAAGE
jgi:hypothetical protein